MSSAYRSRPSRHLGVLALFFGLTLLLTWPLARSLGSAIPGDAFDGWQNYWNLWWVRRSLLELHTHPYFTTALYHPTGVALWFQTINVFNGLASLPVQLAWNLYGAYNAVVLFSFTVAGYGTTILSLDVLRRAGARPGQRLWASSVVAGAVFTFAPFHFAHLLGHMQVFSLQFIPFYVLYLLRSLSSRRGLSYRDATLAALFLILAGLCDWYAVLYLGLWTALALLWLAVRRQLHRPQLGSVALIALLFLVVTSPLLLPMVRESLRYDFMRPPPGQIADLSADLLGFIVPSGQHPLWGHWAAQVRSHFPSSPAENTVYAGLVPTLLAVYGLWRRQLRLWFWAASALTFALFALGPILHIGGQVVNLAGGRPFYLPYALLLRLPFFDIARTVARYDLVVMLSLAILAGGGLYTLLARLKSRPESTQGAPRGRGAPVWGAAVALGLVLFEFAPLPYPVSPPDTPAWYQTLAADPRPGGIMNLPMSWDRPNYLLQQTIHGKPLTAGYISREDPRTLPGRIPVLSDFRYKGPDINAVDVATHAATLFDFAGIRWVVVDRYQMPGGQASPLRAQARGERDVTDALVGAIFQGRSPVYQDDRLSVYETWAPDPPLPFVELGADWGPWRPGPVRLVAGAATLVVHSPDGAPRSVIIVPASNIPFRLVDAAGQQVGASSGAEARWPLNLQPGPNTFTLESDHPGLLIHELRLE